MPRRRVKGAAERISIRDLAVLEFIARFGVVNRDAVAAWAGTGRSVTFDRERRLREAGLISAHPPIGYSGPLLAITPPGLRICELSELGPARLSIHSAFHSIACALVAAELEAGGEHVFSEREIAREERWHGKRIYSARRSYPERGYHRPDLIRLRSDGAEEAIEVELTNKSPERLRSILRAWEDRKLDNRRAQLDDRRYPARVIYLCPAKSLRRVQRAIEKTGSGWVIEAQELMVPTARSPRPDRQASGGLGDGRQPPKGVGPKALDGRAAAATVAGRSGREE